MFGSDRAQQNTGQVRLHRLERLRKPQAVLSSLTEAPFRTHVGPKAFLGRIWHGITRMPSIARAAALIGHKLLGDIIGKVVIEKLRSTQLLTARVAPTINWEDGLGLCRRAGEGFPGPKL
jgi:hypothetical protein